MAEIFNSRDLTLQATVPRLTVTAAIIESTATTFAKPRNVSTITPGSIDLTTIKTGFTNPAYTWSYRPSNSQAFTTIAGATSTSYNITSAVFLSHKGTNATSVEYKLTISQTGWEDASTTVTINYTSAANDVPVATLNKASIILPTSEFGVINYANTNSVITVSIGGSNISYAASGPNTFNIETSVFPLNSVSIGTQTTNTFGNLSNLTAELATITYTVKARDADGVETTIPLTQNVAKAVSGGSALAYKLISPAIVLRNQDNTSFTPAKITFNSRVGTGSIAPVNYAGRFVIQTSTDNVNYTTRYTSAADESSYEYTLSDHGGAYVTSIKVSFYLAGGTTTLIDSEIIPVNRESQFALNLTNDNHTISTNAAGAVVSGLPVSSEAEIYFGLTKQTTGWTFAWTASAGITMAPGTAATSTVTVIAATTNGTVTVVATQTSTGETKTAVFSISRAIGGTNSYRVDLSNNNQTIRINADGVITSPWPTTAITVYDGSTIDTGWSFSPMYSNPLITGTFNTAVTPNTFTLSAFPAAAGLDGYVDIVATKTDKATLIARLTLTKTTNAVIYEITASTDAVSKGISGISTPNSLTFTAYRIDGNNVRTVYTDGVITLQSATAGGAFTALTPTTTTSSTASYTIPANTTFVSIKGILTVGGVAVDNETVPIVSDGPKGDNSLRIDLSNSNQTVRINAAGVVTSTLPVTAVTVFNGGAVDTGWTLSAVYSHASLTGSFAQAVTVNPNIFSITAFPSTAGLTGYVDITATKGTSTLTARFTLSKTSNAVIYEIGTSVNSVSKSIAGVYSPNTLTFTGYQIDGNDVRSAFSSITGYTAQIILTGIAPNGTTTTISTTPLTSPVTSVTYTIPSNNTYVSINGNLTINGTSADNETVPIVIDGPKGDNSFRLDLSNNNQTLKINAAGTVTSPNPTTLVAVYNGTALDAGWTLTRVFSPSTGLTGTFDGSVATILSSDTVERVFTLTSYTNTALDAYVDIIATKTGYANLTTRLTLTKSSNAVTYELIPSARTVAKNISGVSTPNSITFTAYQIDGNNAATVYSGGTITIQAATSGGSFADVVAGIVASSSSYTIPASTTYVNVKGILTVNSVVVDNETIPIVSDGIKGDTGNSVYTGTVYRQIASTTAPSGGSYNFSSGVLTAPTNWSITQPTTTTIPTWACDYTFTGTPASTVAGPVSPATWTNLHIDAQKGGDGSNAITSATVEVYITGAGNTAPGNCTYDFSGGTISGTLNGWSLTMPASSLSGVYMRKQLFTTTAPGTAGSGSAWSAEVLVAKNGTDSTVPGPLGASNYRAYIAATVASPPSASITATIDGAVPAGYSISPVTLGAGQAQYQTDGFRGQGATLGTQNTSWGTPYLSYFKVGDLSAVSVNTGSLTVTDAITMTGTNAYIRGGQTGYNAGDGFFLGNSGGYKFSVGNSTNGLTWSGTALTITGGTLSAPTIKTATTGRRIELNNASNNKLDFYDGNGTNWMTLGGANTTGSGSVLNLVAAGIENPVRISGGSVDVVKIVADSGASIANTLNISTYQGKAILVTETGSGISITSSPLVDIQGNRNAPALYVKNTQGSTTQYADAHGARIYSRSGSVSSIIAVSYLGGGYSFYSESNNGQLSTTDAVSGAHVQTSTGYGPFTGAHDGLLEKTHTAIVPGDILQDHEVVNRLAISDTITTVIPAIGNVAGIGVLVNRVPISSNWVPNGLLKETITNADGDIIRIPIDSFNTFVETHDLVVINAVGEGQINVCGENGDIQKDALIIVSTTIAGKGMRQLDDIIRSRTIARARESVAFSSTSETKQIACIYLCG